MMNLARFGLQLLAALLLSLSLSVSVPAQTEKQIAYGILIDNTGSIRSQFGQVLTLSKGIVDRTYRQGPVSLFTFKSSGRKSELALLDADIEWSQDKDILDSYIDDMYVVGGQTTLLDGIAVIAEQLNSKAGLDKSAFAGKAIFLVTDGEERASKTNRKQLIKMLNESGIQVYAVGLVSELGRPFSKATKQQAISFLEEITKATGGRAVFQESKSNDIDDLLAKLFAK
jgi:hypothetical protein